MVQALKGLLGQEEKTGGDKQEGRGSPFCRKWQSSALAEAAGARLLRFSQSLDGAVSLCTPGPALAAGGSLVGHADLGSAFVGRPVAGLRALWEGSHLPVWATDSRGGEPWIYPEGLGVVAQ